MTFLFYDTSQINVPLMQIYIPKASVKVFKYLSRVKDALYCFKYVFYSFIL